MDGYVELTYWQVAFAALLIVINGAISVALNLRIEKSLLIASLRISDPSDRIVITLCFILPPPWGFHRSTNISRSPCKLYFT